MSNTYSFRDVSATISGPTGIANLGYGAAVANEGISIDMAGDKNTMLIGADGRGMNTLNADKSGTISVRLLKVSPINAILQAMYDAQTLSSSLWGNNTITVRQLVSGDITTAVFCAFKKKPALNYRKEGDILEWMFDSIAIDTVLGSY